MKITFRKIKLSKENKLRLNKINEIIEDYQAQGYKLTLRQLYYQLVSRDVIPNKTSEYAKLSTLLKEGRMSGIVDWDAIEDRLRKPSSPSCWDSPKDIVEAAMKQYRRHRLEGQTNYIEVWVEKDALSGVLKRVTQDYGVPILVNRGYSSASAMFDAYERFKEAFEKGQNVNVLYLGDFDPSGLDMIRDIKERPLEMLFGRIEKRFAELFDEACDENEALPEDLFNEFHLESMFFQNDDYFEGRFHPVKAWIYSRFNVKPIALTREQINLYNPPPNPAKRTDPRSDKFIAAEGVTSWEVDALKPEVLNELLRNEIEGLLDLEKYQKIKDTEDEDKSKLRGILRKL